MTETDTAPAGSLAGLRVIDLTRVLGGPFCTQILGDHGADVIKVEPPQGDEVRDWGPPFHEDDASYFIGVNRNKRAIALDLTQAEGRAVLLRLLEGADVLIENYKPGAMEKWGLGYAETLKAKFPGLIHCRISGYGADGPLGGQPGYDAVVQAMAGHFSINGWPETGPTRIGIPLVDIGTGLYAAIAILMALQERTRSGLGQYIDMTLFDSALALMHPHIPNYLLSGKVPGLTGSAHPNISPYDTFDTASGEIFIAVGNDRAFRRLCAELGAEALADDPRFLKNGDRVTNRDALKAELAPRLAAEDGVALAERLLAAGVPAGAVLNTGQVVNHPHTTHRNMVPEKDWYRGPGTPIKFSRTPGSVRHTPPAFAADTDEVLAEAGYSADEIAALKENGVTPIKRR